MKPARMIGILLIIGGVASLAYSSVTVTHDKKVIDIGPLEVHKESKERIPLPPVLGGVAVVGGIVLLLSESRKS